MNELMNKLKTDFAELDKRFNKKNRDIGLLAIEKTKVIERITNSAGEKALKYIEIASGSPLTEKRLMLQRNLKLMQGPSITNPNYVHTKDKTYRLAWIVAVPLILCILLSGCSGVKRLDIFKEEVREAA